MVQPHGSLPHDDHFHVRIGCPPDSRGCIELPTVTRARRLTHAPVARAHLGPRTPLAPPAPHASADSAFSSNLPPRAAAPAAGVPDDPRAPDTTDDDEAPPAAAWRESNDDVDGPVLVPRAVRAALR
jgi:penicillin-insensitive murein endopeptidase